MSYDRLRQLTLTDDGTVTPEAVEGILEYQEFLCAICGEIPKTIPSLDHIIPLRWGGIHSIINVQMTCRRCNYQKRDKLPSHVSENRTILEDKYIPHQLESIFALSAYIPEFDWEDDDTWSEW